MHGKHEGRDENPHTPEQEAVKIPYKVRSYLDKAYANQPHNICHRLITDNNE